MKNNTNNPKDALFGKKFTEEEIKQLAHEFYQKHFPNTDKYCEACNARNCEFNEYCIKCGCQF